MYVWVIPIRIVKKTELCEGPVDIPAYTISFIPADADELRPKHDLVTVVAALMHDLDGESDGVSRKERALCALPEEFIKRVQRARARRSLLETLVRRSEEELVRFRRTFAFCEISLERIYRRLDDPHRGFLFLCAAEQALKHYLQRLQIR